MNRNVKLMCVFLAVFFLAAPMGIAAFSTTRNITVSENPAALAGEYDFSSRRDPIDVLVYTQYADTNVGGEYDHTMSSLLSEYGRTFQYENLTDYTELSSMINAYDVLLLVEQEQATYSQMDAVAASWNGFITNWVAAGGILICMDFYTPVDAKYGQTLRILNNTNLMKIYNVTAATSASVSVSDAFDPLTFGVSGFTGPSGTLAFDATNAHAVMSVSGHTNVAHRYLGLGHVAMLGFDMYATNVNQEVLLANAVRLTRLAVFDNSHSQLYDPISGFNDFASYMQVDYGFSIATMNTWDESLVQTCQVLVAANGNSNPTAFNATEVSFIKGFVADGGGLLVTTDIWDFGNSTDLIISGFGFERNHTSAYAGDTDDNEGNVNQPVFGLDNIANGSATIGVYSLQLFGPTAFTHVPAGTTTLLRTDTDGTAVWSLGGDASGLTLAGSLHYGQGRVVALADHDFLTDSNNDGDATNDFYDLNNEQFASSIMVWLSASGIPEKTVLVEGSHSPFMGVNAIPEFLHFLTFNGFNVRWVSTFSGELLNDADVVINVNGNINWTTSEKAILEQYVSRGGSLFMTCDFGSYGLQTNDILAAYGMVVNRTSYLLDSDEGWVDSVPGSYIAYEDENMGNHPIMNGVHRIEVDRGTGFSSLGGGTALVLTDDDGTSTWYAGGVANSVPVFAANTHGLGRLVVLPDINFIGDGDPDSDGYPQLYDSDNGVFLANAFYWLIENRAPIVEVLFPNGGEVLNGTKTITWTAVDPNIHDVLTFEIFISDNNGTDWTSLVSGLSVLSYDWNTTLQDDGNEYLVRVVASDGTLTGHDDSDTSFELDNFAGAGLPFDPTLLVIIGIGAIVIIIVIVVVMKRKGNSGK